MDRYRGRGCVCFVHCSDQAGGKLSVRVFTSDQTALTNPSSKTHLVRSHKVWNVFEALLQPLSLSLCFSVCSACLSPQSTVSLSQPNIQRKKRKVLGRQNASLFLFLLLSLCLSLCHETTTQSQSDSPRERERGWLCIRLEIEIWDMKIVAWDECFVLSLYSIQLHHRTVVFMSWDVNLWASLQPRHQHELKRSTRVKVNIWCWNITVAKLFE